MSNFTSFLAEFVEQVEPARAQVIHLPSIVFVFGRHLRDDPNAAPSGMRDMFVAWSHENGHALADLLRLPEEYPEWNQFDGYDDLVTFESDAGSLSRVILIFLESEGAFAELGAFCTQDILAERLFVVLYSKYYRMVSYIALGPLRVVKRVQGNDASICLVDGDTLADFERVLPDLADEVLTKANQVVKTQGFNAEKIRDQFLFIVDIVELFGALSVNEITALMQKFGISLTKQRVPQMLNLLVLLKLVQQSEHLTRHYYVPPKGQREAFLAYRVSGTEARLDRIKFKLRALEFLKKDSFRRQAYEKVHGRH